MTAPDHGLLRVHRWFWCAPGYSLAVIAALAVEVLAGGPAILNASFDVAREFYEDYNQLFIRHYQQETGVLPRVYQSHAGSSKQARAVLDGFPADMVTMNQPLDVDTIAREDKRLVRVDWKGQFPYDSSPCTTTIAFMVRRGNPKGIKNWDDLARAEVGIVIANPKTSGNGRYGYLAGWGYAMRSGAEAREFMAALFANVPTLDTGSRGATTTFVQRGIGDVLISFESEILTTIAEAGKGKFEIVYPTVSIEAEMPVAIVERVVDRKGTRAVATDYLNYLYSEPAQELMAEHGYRPRSASVAERNRERFPRVKMLKVQEHFGGWEAAHQAHFMEGGTFDQIQGARMK